MIEYVNRSEIWDEIARIIMEAPENYILLFGGRNIGKTYTTQRTVIDDCLKNGLQFNLIVPTQRAVKEGTLKHWIEKVMIEQYPSLLAKHTGSTMYVRYDKSDEWRELAHCLALSDYIELKKQPFPLCKYMIMDEAMTGNSRKMSNFMERFNTIYETSDRHENRIRAIFLGNKLDKVNPIYDYFEVGISDLIEGQTGHSSNRFYWSIPYIAPKEGEDAFADMVKGSEYGDMSIGELNTDYGVMIEEPPADMIADSVISVNLGVSAYMMIIKGGGKLYAQLVTKEMAEKYSSRIYQTLQKYAKNEEPLLPVSLKTAIIKAISKGVFKFIDEESLLKLSPKLWEYARIMTGF